jgi:2-C-methyl-D-erythritol 4-phosphate cytidylyltransferase
VAAGRSERFGGTAPKQFREVCGRPLLAWAVDRFEKAGSIDRVVLVVAEDYLLFASEKIVDLFGFRKVAKIVKGGITRRESVLNGLEALPISTELVAIHDGARPLTAPDDIDAVVSVAATDRAAILAVRAADTVKRSREGYILSTLERDALYLAQTPQVFQYDLIMAAHREAAGDALDVTDDAVLIEARGYKVRIVEPSSLNLKVTTPQDMQLAEAVLSQETHE